MPSAGEAERGRQEGKRSVGKYDFCMDLSRAEKDSRLPLLSSASAYGQAGVGPECPFCCFHSSTELPPGSTKEFSKRAPTKVCHRVPTNFCHRVST